MTPTLKTLGPYVIRYRWRYGAALLATLLRVVFTAGIPYAIRVGIDSVGEGLDRERLVQIGAALLGLAALKGVFQYAMRALFLETSLRIEADLARDVTQRLLYLPRRFYQTFSSGELTARSVNDVGAIRMMTGSGFMFLSETTFTFIILLAVMAATDWRLTCLVFVPLPLVSFTLSHYGKKSHRAFTNVQEGYGALTAMIQEHLASIRIVRAYARNRVELENFEALNRSYAESNLQLVDIWKRFLPQLELLTGATYVATLGFGGYQTIQGVLTLGSFVMFMTYMALLASPVAGMGWAVNLMERGSASMRRINEIFHYPVEIEDSPKTDRSIETIRGDLELENVTVIYPGAERPALDSVSLYVPAGRTVALIGAVGAGKSTLLSLIPRLFDPTSGRVLIDGVDARTIPLKTLRAAIGVVPQEPFILGGSLRDNLLLGSAGRPEWELEEIAAACRLNDLSELPAGFDTVVGERGITLSGGQRQRASLARALTQDPRILILDDSLSSVDARTENEILERLQQFMRNRTTLIVSSRIATTRIASQVVVLQQGKVVEAGTHEELLTQGGYYRDLYAKQLLEQELIQDG